ASAVEAARAPQALVGRGVQDVRVARIHDEIRRAREGIYVQTLRPGAPAIDRLEHAALGIPLPEIADRGDIRDIGIGRMEDDAANRAGVVETEVRPRVAGVGRAVHAAAPRRALPIVLFTRARPDDAGVACEDCERAEAVVRLPVEDRLPRDA